MGFQLAAQPADQHLDDVGVAFVVVRLELLHQPFLGDHLLLVTHQVFQNAIFKGGQRQGLVTHQRLFAVEVKLERAGFDARLGEAGRASQQRVEPCLQLLELEGLTT